MTQCAIDELSETQYGDPKRRELRDAAVHNDQRYFDEWTAARPAHEWPAAAFTTGRQDADHRSGDVPLVPASEAVSTDAWARRELVHVRSLPGDVLGTSGPSQSDAACAPTLPPELVNGRRKHKRVHGPFDGVRVGALETPVQLYDLSCGGCFINSMHQQQPGIKLVLKLNLPQEGWIAVRAVTLDRRGDLGFAVRFIDISQEAGARLERALTAMEQRDDQDA
jgi:hypothetical protein